MEEEEKSWTDARSGVRTGLGLGFEIAANTGLDAFSFIPGSQQAGSAFINYLAQKIRGGEVSKGEILAAAATSQIPGLAQARALTRGGRFYRSVAKGGIAGGVTTTSMSLVDEKELPSFGEFATGVTAGGVMGGAFDLAPAAFTGKLSKEASDIKYDSDVFLRQLKSRITGGPRIDHPDIVYRSGQYGFGEGTVGAAKPKGSGDPEGLRSLKYQEGEILANTPAKNVKLLKELNLTDDESVFLLSNYYKEGSDTATTLSRDQVAAIESLYTTVEEFDKTKDLALPYFLRGMKGIKRSKTPELDHIAQLKSSLPFFNNAKVSQFPEITKIILEEGVYGLGHQRGNFKYLEYDVHKVKSNYFRSKVGDNGEIFFKDRDISTPTKLRAAAKEYAKIINDSNNIVADAIEQYKFMNKVDINEEELDKFIDILSSQPTRRKYSIKQVRDIFKQMEEDGFIQTAKQSKQVEAAEIKAEDKAAADRAKNKARFEAEEAEVDRTLPPQVYIDWVTKNQNKFPKKKYAYGMRDPDLYARAAKIIDEDVKNRLSFGEAIQGSLFAEQDRETKIINMMRAILGLKRKKK